MGAVIARLIVISGPSGAGKGTLISLVMARMPGFSLSVSATTRARRRGEQNGREYFFLTQALFKRWVADGRFLEWAEYAGNFYGTPAEAVRDELDAGNDVILEIEMKGAEQILRICPDALMIYIMPPSLPELERRLRGRSTENEEAIKSRLARARVEMALVEAKVQRGLPSRHYVIVDDSVNRAGDELATIINQTREEDEQTYCR